MGRMMLALLGMVIATLLIHAGSVKAQNYTWCSQGANGGTNCGFVSYEQCGASSRCYRNPLYEPPGEPRSRRTSRGRQGKQ
jgi:Protein of unknown function (DUF3551)